MDYKRLYQDTINKKFTDCKIIISKANISYEFHGHKIFLSLFCPYFDSLFTHNNKTEYQLQLDNTTLDARILYEAVLSLYDTIFTIPKVIIHILRGNMNWKYSNVETI